MLNCYIFLFHAAYLLVKWYRKNGKKENEQKIKRIAAEGFKHFAAVFLVYKKILTMRENNHTAVLSLCKHSLIGTVDTGEREMIFRIFNKWKMCDNVCFSFCK